MEKKDAVAFMLNSINEDNRDFCAKAGMDESEIEAQVIQSQPALHIISRNLYDRMKDAGLLA